ncbi:MAG: hypothetical protein Kow0079_03690 [Vicingaceae bacterium]
MIGMMYLVLTALLAMNVSKDILDAFIVVNGGIENSTTTFADKNELYYRAFASAALESKAAVPYKEKADKVKMLSDEMYNHIKELKKHLIRETEKLPENAPDSLFSIEKISAKDNYDIPTHAMGLANPATPTDGEWSAVDLKNRINKYRQELLDLFKEHKDAYAQMEKSLSTLETKDFGMVNGTMETWETGNFYHVPLAAVITILSKIQSDIRSAEAEAVAKLYENIDAGTVSFNEVEGFAYAKRSYVMDTDSFHSEIFTAAYDSRQNPDIYIGKFDSLAIVNGETDPNKFMIGTKGETWEDFKNGGWYQLKKVKGGKGYLDIKESIGLHEYGGVIVVKTKKGPKCFPFKSQFQVDKPSTTIAATKMNVFYIGVDNPVSVSAPVPNFTASGPGLTKTAKGYIMRPKTPGNVTITVTADVDGKKVNLGKGEFRVKRLPEPKSYFAGQTGSFALKKGQLKAASSVQAKMDNFDFDLNVNVNSFIFSTTKAGDIIEVKVNGNNLNDKCKTLIDQARRNQKFFIEKIMCKMPDGTTRELSPIVVKTI